jgi:hypothetical protein
MYAMLRCYCSRKMTVYNGVSSAVVQCNSIGKGGELRCCLADVI